MGVSSGCDVLTVVSVRSLRRSASLRFRVRLMLRRVKLAARMVWPLMPRRPRLERRTSFSEGESDTRYFGCLLGLVGFNNFRK